MKLIPAGQSGILGYAPYSYNCNLGPCRHAFYAPIPSVFQLQLYANLGVIRPVSITFQLIDLCRPNNNFQIVPDCMLIAFNGSYWYGVFKNFEPSGFQGTFIIAAEVTYENDETGTFFSQQYQAGKECGRLTMVSVCYPENYDAEDINGIYIGKPVLEGYPHIGNRNVFYQHQYWVRSSEINELQNKITYTSNSRRNFASRLNKVYEFSSELVPGWYKDYLLSVYFRGNFMIDGISTKASDIATEPMDAEADLWQASAKIDKELKGSFGCAPITCEDVCVVDCEFNPSDLTLSDLTETGFKVAVSNLRNTTECIDTWDVIIKEVKTGNIVASKYNMMPTETYTFTGGTVNTEYEITAIKHCCDTTLTATLVTRITTSITGNTVISGTFTYNCQLGPGNSQGRVTGVWNFDNPLPAAMRFHIGQVVSSGGFLTNKGYLCFTGMPGTGVQGECFVQDFPVGADVFPFDGINQPTTNPGRNGWPCTDGIGSDHTTDLYFKIVTPGYTANIRMTNAGITPHNQ